MNWLFILLAATLVIQVTLFFYIRKLKQSMKSTVIEKYNLKTAKDAWEALANPEIPENDKIAIRKLYHGEK